MIRFEGLVYMEIHSTEELKSELLVVLKKINSLESRYKQYIIGWLDAKTQKNRGA